MSEMWIGDSVGWLSHPLAQRLTWTFVHALWQGALIWLLCVLLLGVVRRPTSRYALLLGGFLLLACVVPVTFWLSDVPEGWRTTEAPVAEERAPAALAGTGPVEEGRAGTGVALAASVPLPDAAESVPDSETRAATWWHRSQPYGFGLWIVGVLALTARIVLGFGGLRRLRRAARPLPEALAARAGELSRRLGLRRRVTVLQTARFSEAVAFGLLRPVILIPAPWLAQMSPALLEAILAHELAHIRRRDLWVVFLQRCVETWLFFHPVVWWMSRRLRIERELCCDELAVRVTGRRADYARALEIVARHRLPAAKSPLVAALRGDKKMHLLRRVRHVLGQPSSVGNRGWWSAGVLLLVLSVTAWLAVSGVPGSLSTAWGQEDQEAEEEEARRQRRAERQERRRAREAEEAQRAADEARRSVRDAMIEQQRQRAAIDAWLEARQEAGEITTAQEAFEQWLRAQVGEREWPRTDIEDREEMLERMRDMMMQRQQMRGGAGDRERELAETVEDLQQEIRELQRELLELRGYAPARDDEEEDEEDEREERGEYDVEDEEDEEDDDRWRLRDLSELDFEWREAHNEWEQELSREDVQRLVDAHDRARAFLEEARRFAEMEQAENDELHQLHEWLQREHGGSTDELRNDFESYRDALIEQLHDELQMNYEDLIEQLHDRMEGEEGAHHELLREHHGLMAEHHERLLRSWHELLRQHGHTHGEEHEHGHEHAHDEGHDHGHAHDEEHDHEHAHDEEHEHEHAHDEEHEDVLGYARESSRYDELRDLAEYEDREARSPADEEARQVQRVAQQQLRELEARLQRAHQELQSRMEQADEARQHSVVERERAEAIRQEAEARVQILEDEMAAMRAEAEAVRRQSEAQAEMRVQQLRAEMQALRAEAEMRAEEALRAQAELDQVRAMAEDMRQEALHQQQQAERERERAEQEAERVRRMLEQDRAALEDQRAATLRQLRDEEAAAEAAARDQEDQASVLEQTLRQLMQAEQQLGLSRQQRRQLEAVQREAREARAEAERYRQELVELRTRLQRSEQQLQQDEEDEGDDEAGADPGDQVDREIPLVEASVVGVAQLDSEETGRVYLSIGADDGLRRGDALYVYREDQCIARVELIELTADASVGRILEQYTEVPVALEMRVTTRDLRDDH